MASDKEIEVLILDVYRQFDVPYGESLMVNTLQEKIVNELGQTAGELQSGLRRLIDKGLLEQGIERPEAFILRTELQGGKSSA